MNSAQKSWLLYDPAISAYAMIVRTVAAPIFFAHFAGGIMSQSVSTAAWGYSCSIAGIVAGVISVLAGPVIDARRKKVQAVAFFTVMGVLSTLAYLLIPALGVPEIAPYLILAINFAGIIAFMGANSFYDSLLIDITCKNERDKVSSLGFALGYAGALVSFLLTMPFLKAADGKYFFTGAFTIAALWWISGSMPLFFKVKETAVTQANSIKLGETLKFIFTQKNILFFLIAYFLYIDGVGTIMMQATLIANSLKISETYIMLTILGLQVIGLPFTLLFGFLANKFSAKKMIYSAIVIYILIAAIVGVMSFTPHLTLRQILFFTAAGLIGTAQGGIQSLSRSLFSKIIPQERAAELFAVYNIFGRFTTIVGPLLMIPAAVFLWDKAELGITLMIVPFITGFILLSKVKVPEN